MLAIWHNPLLTLPELAEYTGLKYSWLVAASRLREGPLPTMLRGKRPVVLYSEFLAWFDALYGMEGERRGQEELATIAAPCRRRARKGRTCA